MHCLEEQYHVETSQDNTGPLDSVLVPIKKPHLHAMQILFTLLNVLSTLKVLGVRGTRLVLFSTIAIWQKNIAERSTISSTNWKLK